MLRSRWAAIGAAVAVSLGAGGIGLVSATSPRKAVTFVPIEPCRLFDTRPDFQVGDRSAPLGPNDTFTTDAHGDNGECAGIPASATGLGLNVTAVDPSRETVLTVWGAGDRPNASSLNPTPGQPPTPNAVTTGLTGDGELRIWNAFGTVHVLADVVGYYTDHHHDDRYYTQDEVDAAVAAAVQTAKSVVAHAATSEPIELPLMDPLVAETVSLVAPSAGTVFVDANAVIHGPGGVGDSAIWCSISPDTAIDTDRAQYLLKFIEGGTRSVSLSRTFDVTDGESFTANLVCELDGGVADIRTRSLTAIFLPG